MLCSIKGAKVLIALSVALVLGLALLLILDLTGLPLVSQTTFDNQFELHSGGTVGQSFVGQAPGLYRLDLLVARRGANSHPVLFHLEEEEGSGEHLLTVELNASALEDTCSLIRRPNTYQSFTFTPIESSEGSRLYFEVESPRSTSEQPLLVSFQSHDVYVEGTRYVDGFEDCGDLAFKAYYRGTQLATATLLLSRLTEGKPAPFSQPACYVIPLFAYLLIFARLVHEVSALWIKCRNDHR